MRRLVAPVLLAALLLASGCGGGFVFVGDFGGDDGEAFFTVRLRGHGTTQDFLVVAPRDGEFARRARAELLLPPEQRRLVVVGRVARGNGGFNAPWAWHLDDVRFTGAPAAACDALPRDVEADPAGWIERTGQFCPSAGFIAAER